MEEKARGKVVKYTELLMNHVERVTVLACEWEKKVRSVY